MLDRYIRWAKRPVPWWKVWDPRTGLLGGVIIMIVFMIIGWVVSHWLLGG
jgi:hypothetical protein